MILNMTGGGNPLNFKVVGGTSAPASPKENTIWVNTDTAIAGWHFGADEPNVYDVQAISDGDPHHLICPHKLSEGDIINFVIPARVYSTFEAIRIYDGTKFFYVRDWDGTALQSWGDGFKVSLRITEDNYPVNNWGGDSGDGSAIVTEWEGYYHEEGTVWIQTGTSSPVAFNALKKNCIQVCPISAKQYVNGAWVSKDAKIYQNGAWVEWAEPWNGELFQNGNQYTDITGGWSESGYYYYSANYQTVAPEIGNTIKLTANGYNQCCVAGTQKAVDLTKAKTLYLDVLSTVGQCFVCIVDSNKNVYSDKWIAGRTLAAGTITLDVTSVSGNVYIALFAVQDSDHPTNTAEVNNIRWE